MPQRRNKLLVPSPMVRPLALLASLSLASLPVNSAGPKSPFDGADTFIQQHCSFCHSSPKAVGHLDLVNLKYEPANPDNFATWIKVHDRVSAGEMPPAGMPRPAGSAQFVQNLSDTLTKYEQSVIAERGRACLRRLNAYEYENSIRDLLAIPWAQLKNRLPQDGESYRYNKIGTALDVSHVQLSRYMSSADYALREAMAVKLVQAPVTVTRIYARQEASLRNFRPREGNTRTDRLNFPVLDSHAQPDVRSGRSAISSPETKEREAVGRVSSIFSDAGGFGWSFHAPVAGRYRIRLKGYTIWVSGGGVDHWNYIGFGDQKAPYLYQTTYHRPNPDEIWSGRRNEPIGIYAQSSGQSRALGAFDFTPEPSIGEIEVTLAANEGIQTDPMRFFRTRVNGTEEEYTNPLAKPDGMPGVAFQWFEVEGPLADPKADAGYRVLFGDLPLRRLHVDEAGGVTLQIPPQSGGAGGPAALAGGGRPRAPRMEDAAVEVVTDHPHEDGERLLHSFMAKAYRRPFEEAHFKRFLALFNQQFDLNHSFAKSMLSAYTAVLTSPGWLYIQESPGKLDDYALATRLSLFLWNSAPDDQLRSLAAAGRLHNPDVLKVQTERLLDDSKSRRFIDAFTDYWLDLRKIDDSSPSTTLYNDYELDDPLKLAAVEETRLFVQELFAKNLPVRTIINSDFTFLNERLAQHYGVPGVTGAAMRRVTLPKYSVRGGVMTQASVLKVTANGTTTSPVIRGVWIMERILGYHTAPPAGVPAIEPDIRGAVTIRQQLDKHRADPICAACHRKIDPPGFALESFDVMGGYRDHYRAFADGVKPEPGIGMSGQPFAFRYGLPVDSAGSIENGPSFKDIREFKDLLLKSQEQTVARNMVAQLATYSTGAPIGFTDRGQVDEILDRTRDSSWGIRSIVHGIVQSQMFQSK